MSIRRRLTITFAVATVFIAIAAVSTIILGRSIQQSFARVSNNTVPAVVSLGQAEADVRALANEALVYDPAMVTREVAEGRINEGRVNALLQVEGYVEALDAPADPNVVAQLRADIEAVADAGLALVAARAEGDDPMSVTAVNDLFAAIRDFDQQLTPIFDVALDALDETEQGAVNSIRQQQIFIFLFFITLIAAIIGFNQLVLREFVQPILHLRDTALRIRDGNLEAKIDVKRYSGEPGVLAGALDEMVRQLRSNITYVNSVLESMAESLIIIDTSERITNVNTTTLDMLGYAREELIGLPLADIVKQSHADTQTLPRGVAVNRVEALYQTKGGHQMPVLFSSSLLQDENNQTIGIICVARDISDRKRTEEALESALRRNDALLNALPDLAFVVMRDGTYKDFIPGANDELAVPRGKIIGKHIQDFTFADASRDRLVALINAALDTGTIQSMEYDMSSSIGPRSFDARIAPFGDDEVLIIARDITERHEAETALRENERRLATLMGNLPGMAYRSQPDDDRTMMFVSQGALNITGYRPQDFTAGQVLAYADLIFEEDLPTVTAAIDNGMDNHTAFTAEYRLRARDGSVKWVYERGIGVYDRDGELIALEGLVTDITQLREANEALRESQQRLALLVQQAPVAVIEWDTNLRILSWNPAAEHIFGYEAEEVIGQPMSFIVPPDNAIEVNEAIRRTIYEGITTASTNENITSTGDIITCEWYNTPLVDEHGEVIGVAGIALDVTERLTAEVALRESEQRNRAMLDAIPDQILRLDADGMFLDAKTSESGGVPLPRPIMGSHLLEVMPNDVAKKAHRYIRQVLDNGEVRRFDFTLPNPTSGAMEEFEARMVVSGEQEVMALIRDISERKRAEQAVRSQRAFLNQVIDANPNRIFVRDWNGRYVLANSAMAQGHGIRVRDMIGKTELDLTGDERFFRKFLDQDRQVMRSRKPMLIPEEVVLDRRNGETTWAQTIKVPLFNDSGEADRVLAVFVDITQRKKAEDEMARLVEDLQAAREEALESSRLKSEFLATMSHELRTPLNAIIGFSGIMKEGVSGVLDDVASGMVDAIYDSGTGLLHIINDILDIAKIEAGRMDIVPDEFSLRELSDGWHERMIVLAEQKEIELVMRIEEDVPPILYGDTQRITQIAVNLLSNAIKFTGEGSVTMHARWQAEALVMDFIDTGVGIPPHALMYIFDEFRQVDGSSKRTHGGTGLGLSIVSKLAKAMGGTVTVESELGVGSTFTVILPLPIHAPETEVIEEKQG